MIFCFGICLASPSDTGKEDDSIKTKSNTVNLSKKELCRFTLILITS